MYILLPNTKTGLKRLIRDVTGSYVKQFSFLMDEVNIQVSLPKFKFEYKSQYKELLQKVNKVIFLRCLLNHLFLDGTHEYFPKHC